MSPTKNFPFNDLMYTLWELQNGKMGLCTPKEPRLTVQNVKNEFSQKYVFCKIKKCTHIWLNNFSSISPTKNFPFYNLMYILWELQNGKVGLCTSKETRLTVQNVKNEFSQKYVFCKIKKCTHIWLNNFSSITVSYTHLTLPTTPYV